MDGFIRISKYAGMREDLVQAGGGNSSFKASAHRMYIKASGYQLTDVTENDGYAIVDPAVIKDIFLYGDRIDLLTEEDSTRIFEAAFIEGKKPSIEVFLHAMSGKYTLHTHPIVVNALACRKDGMCQLKRLFPGALMIPYATPGIELSKTYFKAYKEQADVLDQIYDVVFLQNHGLLISADSAEKVIEKTEYVLGILEGALGVDYKGYHALTRVWELFEKKIVWKVTDENVLKQYYRYGGIWKHTFCPDCVVFLGKKALILSDNLTRKVKEDFCERYGDPAVVIYKDELYVVADNVKKAMEIQSVLSFSAQVMMINKGQEMLFLPNEEKEYLLNWDAEKYRRGMR